MGEQLLRLVPPAVQGGARGLAALARYARLAGATVATQPSGHGASGNAGGVILLRTGRLDELEIRPRERLARAGAGVRWGRVLEAASPHGLTGLAGSSPLAAVNVAFLGDGGDERLHARRARPAPRAEARPRPARRPPQQLPGPRLSGRCGRLGRAAAQSNGGSGETALRVNGAAGERRLRVNGDAPASVGGVRGGRVRGEGQLKYSMNGFFLLGSEAVPALTTAVVPGRQSASVAWTVPERAGPLRVVQDEPL